MKKREMVRQALVPGLALTVLTAWLFWPASGYELVDLDDLMYISQNRIVLNGLAWPSVRMAFTEVWQGMWAPVLWLSYMLDVELFGTGPWGFHFTNILLHGMNTVLLFALFLGWTRKPWRAFWAAAFWAAHPLRVESVAWVSERKDVLSGFFFLLCVGFYWMARRGEAAAGRRGRRMLYGASVVMLILGLLVKPMLMTTPFVLLLLDCWPLKRWRVEQGLRLRRILHLVLEKWPFWAVSAGAAFVAFSAHAGVGAVNQIPLAARLKMVPLHYAFYLFKMALPRDLTVLYQEMLFGWFDLLVALLLLGGVTLWTWTACKKNGNELMGWAWFLGLFLPVIGIVRFGAQSLADRFTYLPAIGLSMALLAALAGRGAAWRRTRAAICGMVLVCLGVLTRQQLPFWKNTAAVYENVLRYFPLHQNGLYYQAALQFKQGSPDDAQATFEKIRQINPAMEPVNFGIALCMSERGDDAGALEWLKAQPPATEKTAYAGYWEWHMAMIAFQIGRHDEALHYLEQAMCRMPINDNSRNDLAVLGMAAAFEKGDSAGALAWARQWPPYRGKTEIGLPDLMPHYLKQWTLGQRRATMEYFRRLLQAFPENVDAANNVAWILATAAWSPASPEETLAYARRARKLGGDHPALLDTMSAAFAHAGDFTAARECAEQALALLRTNRQADTDLYRNIDKRLDAYRQNKPWREEEAALRLLQSFYVH